ncbi:MAG: hypothetical protein JXL97_15870 [Bacteroidales bacterium]|nr:hypothetical protein [Bacteroidales bacterium]
MKKIFIITLTLTLVFLSDLTAQRLSSSPFSRYGVGDLFFQGNGRQIAMGNTGIADFNSAYISKLNPASVSALKPNSVIFEVGTFHKLSFYNNGFEKQTNNITNFKQVTCGFRINNWWHTSFGLAPYSGVGYRIITYDTLNIDDEFQTSIISDYDGKGGINQLFWGNSFTLFNHFSVGANINYNFGSIDRNTKTILTDTLYSSFTSLTTTSNRNIFKKVNVDFGFIYADTIKKDDYNNLLSFSAGAIFTNNYDINVTQTRYVSRSTSVYDRTFTDSIYLDTVSNSLIGIPRTIGFGTSLCFYNKLTISGDYIVRNWSKSSILGETNFVNSSFIGLGAEFVNDPYSSTYFKTIRYRLGAFQNNSYMLYNDQQIVTQALTFGLGFPIKTVQLNLGFVIGKTGSIDLGLQENFYEFNMNVSLYDLWFVKRKFM